MIIQPSQEGFKVAFPTDEHFPFQDERARTVAMRIINDFDPHVLVCGSDGIDFYTISRFDKDPKRQFDLQNEIDSWTAGVREWADAAPNAQLAFIPGNHEDRLRRYIWRHPEMAGLDALRLDRLLGLRNLNILYEEGDALGESYTQSELSIGPLLIKHGSMVRKHSAYTARGEMEKEFYNVPVLLTGHTHRGGCHMAQTRNGLVRAYESFCLCDTSPAYVTRPNWMQGIVIATIYGTLIQVEPIPFIDMNGHKCAIWRDRLYTSG